MKPLEEELKSALRRIEPPDGFAERVLAEARRGRHSKPGFGEWLRAALRPRAVRWAAGFALVCLLVVFGAIRRYNREQARIQGERAGAQARLALQIASTKLNAVLKVAATPGRGNLKN
jgi:hypothetical protein